MQNGISIITPCFNSEKTIARTLESVLSQTYTNYEYIIIDGGSSDSTVRIIRDYEERFDGKLRYISEKDNGIYDAMNKGIKMSTGEIVGIVNSDDFYEPDCLENVMAAYHPETKYQIIYGALRIINEHGEELQIILNSHHALPEIVLMHPSSFVSRTIYQDMSMYDTKYRYSSDYDFMIKVKQSERVSFYPVYKILSNFQVGGASYTKEAALETNEIRYKYGCCSKKKYTWVKTVGMFKILFHLK